MTAQTQSNQAQNNTGIQPVQDNKISDKELNFRKQEQMYQKMLKEKEDRIHELERRSQQISSKRHEEEDEDDDEPYVDRKKLNKTLEKFGEKTIQQTQSEIQKAVQMALSEERKQNWIKSNPDFYDVLQHADKFAQRSPELAESILEMPEGFERQKLVYKNIKALGIDKPEQKQSSIQDKIDANRKSPYYQPSGVGSTPYSPTGDFSTSGQKNAYNKMQELKSRLRI